MIPFQEANTDDEAELEEKLNDCAVDNGPREQNGLDNEECATDDDDDEDVALEVNTGPDSNDEEVEPTEENLPNGDDEDDQVEEALKRDR